MDFDRVFFGGVGERVIDEVRQVLSGAEEEVLHDDGPGDEPGLAWDVHTRFAHTATY